MCPDRQILSVYIDGELPSPWKEKMEGHLSQCPQCRQLLERYRLGSIPESAVPAAAETAAHERVWQKIEAGIARKSAAGQAVFWERRLSVPLPAAAAAAAVLFIAFALLWTRKPAVEVSAPGMTFASEELDAPGIVPVSNMGDVLQYLGSGDSGDILILRLPESRSFSSSGEPAIIKAADYPRRKP
jgi:anti-sigma factor RsiW